MSENDRPLITLALFAYNQERFIREALAGVFSQTYSPLQIILSDDHSSDATYAIMEKEASQYAGANKILLNRNAKNLGIGQHVNKIMALAEGELVVGAAGDDVSLPCRSEKIFKKWIQLDKGTVSIHSSVIKIGINGEDLGLFKTLAHDRVSPVDMVMNSVIIGASHAWSKKLFTVFGDLDKSIAQEDRVIGFRASLLDGVHFIDEPLVKYRLGGVTTKEFNPSNVDELLFAESRTRASREYSEAMQGLLDIQKIESVDTGLVRKLLVQRCNLSYIQMKLAMGSSPILLLIKNSKKISFSAIINSIRYLFPNLYWKYHKFKHRKKF